MADYTRVADKAGRRDLLCVSIKGTGKIDIEERNGDERMQAL